ncbi:hypothetical protein E2C01_074497 [Portunus trituberculatus]|uniref:Uncharacterized protein n=1 Tax=Portunus trituberculatus TaxID=210409 RepID=A0A5B7IDN4_PORTR|nr:hypothetical protein [Portunus trituberculatus]
MNHYVRRSVCGGEYLELPLPPRS